jgi:hypothetical protein
VPYYSPFRKVYQRLKGSGVGVGVMLGVGVIVGLLGVGVGVLVGTDVGVGEVDGVGGLVGSGVVVGVGTLQPMLSTMRSKVGLSMIAFVSRMMSSGREGISKKKRYLARCPGGKK